MDSKTVVQNFLELSKASIEIKSVDDFGFFQLSLSGTQNFITRSHTLEGLFDNLAEFIVDMFRMKEYGYEDVVYMNCPLCGGNRVCQQCYSNPMVQCDKCGTSGLCHRCGGSGKVEK